MGTHGVEGGSLSLLTITAGRVLTAGTGWGGGDKTIQGEYTWIDGYDFGRRGGEMGVWHPDVGVGGMNN